MPDHPAAVVTARRPQRLLHGVPRAAIASPARRSISPRAFPVPFPNALRTFFLSPLSVRFPAEIRYILGPQSKSKLRKVVCFNFQKNGCSAGADCEKLHPGEPGSMRAEILAKLAKKNGVKKGAAHWDAKRPQSAASVAAAEEGRARKKAKKQPQSDNINCQLYVRFDPALFHRFFGSFFGSHCEDFCARFSG